MGVKSRSATSNGNVVVLFMPFTCQNSPTEVGELFLKYGFHAVEDHGGYLYPYVHKTSVPEQQTAKCSHFKMDIPSDEFWEVAPDGQPHSSERARTAYQKRKGIAILNPTCVHLYLFRTRLHLFAYELSVHAWTQDATASSIPPLRDPFRIAATLQGLSRLSSSNSPSNQLSQMNRIRQYGELGAEGLTLIQMAEDCLRRIGIRDVRLFEHAAQTPRKAGVFVHVQTDDSTARHVEADHFFDLVTATPGTHGHKAALFYLANMWDCATFPYDGTSDTNPLWFTPAPDIEWAVSYETLACITSLHNNESREKHIESRNEFLSRTFERNVRTSYLFLYALLLHQKYSYLLQLTTLNARAAQNDDELRTNLRDSQRTLEEFRLDYVYARVSDTPQYQMLYERVRKAFALDAMEADIREPINELARLERVEEKREAEREKRKDDIRESKLNRAMYIVAALSIVSTFVDGNETFRIIIGCLPLNKPVAENVQRAISAVLFALLLGVFVAVMQGLTTSDTGNDD